MIQIRHFILGISACLGLLSCDTNRVYESNQALDEQTWKRSNRLTFSVPLEAPLSAHNLFFNLRNTESYPYNNLYVLLELKRPSGHIEKDTLEFILCQPNGKWLGQPAGGIITHQILFQRQVIFPDTGHYDFTFSQIMRPEDLNGIMDVGLRVENANP